MVEPFPALSPAQLARLFPFFLAWDAEGCVVRVGPRLEAMLADDGLGQHADALFEVQMGRAPVATVADLPREPDDAVVLRARWRSLCLYGDVLALDECNLFVGSPRPARVSELTAVGWTVSNLPLHDPRGELLVANELLHGTVEQTRALARKLRTQRTELRAARDAAQQAAEAERAFLANMSHEIRTPLHGVLGLADALQDSELLPAQATLVETLRRSGAGLLRVLNDVLDVSRLASGRVELDPSPCDVQRLLRDLAALHGPAAAQKGIRLRMCSNARTVPVWLHLDGNRVAQVLGNLVGNALKFTDSGEVVVDLRWADDTVTVEVRDTGIGLSEDQAARIFSRFRQADRGTSRQYGGTGLGLSICKQLVELMGGELTVQSVLGQGSAFRMVLPALSAAEPPSADTLPDVRPMRVLVVDDNRVNLMVARLTLTKLGHTVLEAGGGEEGVDKALSEAVDVVLMDYHMPGVDGLEATRRIVGATGAAGPPVVGLTAAAFAEDRAQCLGAGMVEVLTKPLERRALVAVLARLQADQEASRLHEEPLVTG